MSGTQFCSEQEAVELAGVSTRTLMRFSEAGYLSVRTSSDGSKLFERVQLEQIFGISAGVSPSSPAETIVDQPCDNTGVSDRTSTTWAENDQEATVRTLPSSDPWREPLDTEPATIDTSKKSSPSEEAEEISRLKNLLAFQERILDAKDDEIADLKSQRAWLRERIEKLEEKSDRDQILLLSETQTIRSLIAYQEARKSPIRQFLEWTGLASPQQMNTLPQSAEYKQNTSGTSSRTIEVPRAANGD
jgi:hypothetical protein